ncbi:hypothetical protein G134_1732 [Lactobacillus delbrueckii subsp. lactis CRL581]|nr:hypothetical protein G134_1732 [Lactobacillus delbrueckii subsp. lactis CRL581]
MCSENENARVILVITRLEKSFAIITFIFFKQAYNRATEQ